MTDEKWAHALHHQVCEHVIRRRYGFVECTGGGGRRDSGGGFGPPRARRSAGAAAGKAPLDLPPLLGTATGADGGADAAVAFRSVKSKLTRARGRKGSLRRFAPAPAPAPGVLPLLNVLPLSGRPPLGVLPPGVRPPVDGVDGCNKDRSLRSAADLANARVRRPDRGGAGDRRDGVDRTVDGVVAPHRPGCPALASSDSSSTGVDG